LKDNLNPDTVRLDFEKAAINSMVKMWPEIQVIGCHFHLGQSFYRNICEKGLKRDYDTDPDFSASTRTLLALAFVPLDRVIEFFEHIVDEDIIPLKAASMITYFEDTYIGKLSSSRSGRRKKPMFPMNTWNCYELSLQDGDLTNNRTEAVFRSLQSDKRTKSDSIWELLEVIKEDYCYNELKYQQIQSGTQDAPQRKSYRDFASRRKRIVADMDSYESKSDYLFAVATNIEIYFVDV
jgi:hypothetical protein